MESLIYSDTRLGRLGKRPLTRPLYLTLSMVLPSFVTTELPLRQSTYGISQINLLKTDMFKSGVKPSIRRTGAELFDFLVFGYFTGQIVAKKWKFEMN